MKNNKKIDWIITFIPLLAILTICGFLLLSPERANLIISQLHFFFIDTIGIFYLVVGLAFFLISIFIAFSKYGNIVLGSPNEKPKYSFFSWGSMLFTCGLAADIIFYSFAEPAMYTSDPYINSLGDVEKWSSVYPVFHWSFIPWSFYLVMATAFGFMLHVKNKDRQKFSEACRPVLKNKADGMLGRFIDLFAVFALLAGTATTFSVATPLMSNIINSLLGTNFDTKIITIIILIITCSIYTFSLLKGIKGIKYLAQMCMFLFFGLLAFVFIFSGQYKYILKNSISSFVTMVVNFFHLATYSDPERIYSFPQNYTIYYWAYWIVWCISVPFFIGSISRGRTIRQTILGGYIFGVGSTILSFNVLGNYALSLFSQNRLDFSIDNIYSTIISIINTLPCNTFFLVLILATMISFYSTSFDAIALTAARYSYKSLEEKEQPSKPVLLLWCILLILLPISLVFADSSLGNLQSVSIIAAFPVGIIMIIIIFSFFKDARNQIKKLRT